jgi:hypothetical protein
VFGAGLAVYIALRSHRHPVRTVRLLIVVLVLVGTYVASTYGPPPPSMTMVAVSDLAFLLGISALAGWADQRATAEELTAQRLSAR